MMRYGVGGVAVGLIMMALSGRAIGEAISPPLPLISDEATPLPVAIAPASSQIRYSGRFDKGGSAPKCSWSASAVTLKFSGERLNVRLNGTTDKDHFEVVIDGVPAGVLQVQSGSHRYAVYPVASAAASPVPHTITLFKRTEARLGITTIEGFEVAKGGRLLSLPAAPKRRIEVIGDSISCGYGNEGANEKEKFTPATENAYLTYGAMAARKFGADYTCIAWSGRTMWPGNTMNEVYDRTLPTDTASRWNFSQWTPDVVVINLSSNDFAPKVFPEEEGWVKGYRAFIARVRKNYPRAVIYCTSSPMLWAERDKVSRQYLHRIVDEENKSGDKKVHFLDFKTQNPANGLGAAWHPNVKTQGIMAENLADALERDLKWQAVSKP
jgi:lysophospholipase L1-like esterase